MILLTVQYEEINPAPNEPNEGMVSLFWGYSTGRHKTLKVVADFLDQGVKKAQAVAPKGYRINGFAVEYNVFSGASREIAYFDADRPAKVCADESED